MGKGITNVAIYDILVFFSSSHNLSPSNTDLGSSKVTVLWQRTSDQLVLSVPTISPFLISNAEKNDDEGDARHDSQL